MEPRLEKQLHRLEERRRGIQRDRVSAWVWGLFAVLALGLFFARGAFAGHVLTVAVALAATALVTVLVLRAVHARRPVDLRETAHYVEGTFTKLDSALFAAIDLEPDLPDGKYGYLAKRLIDEVLQQSHRHPWSQLVPDGHLKAARFMQMAVASVFAGFALLLGGSSYVPGLSPIEHPEAVVLAAEVEVTVLPGDAEVERGRSVLVSAQFASRTPGEFRLPAEVELVYTTLDDEGDKPSVTRTPLSRSLDDPIFAGRIPEVETPTEYHVAWRGGVSPTYRLETFAYPELVRSDVRLDYPAHMERDSETIEDTRRVTAAVGTRLTLACRWNVAVAEAWLLEDDDPTLALEPVDGDPLAATVEFILHSSRTFTLALTDAKGRTNQRATRFVFKATPNLPPRITAQTRDTRLSPLEELTLRAQLKDDFGLARYGVGYSVGGNEPTEIVLGESLGESANLQHTLALEELGVEPAQLVTYHFWAEDVAADGETRRTTSDLYFGEVRPFEEIFREAPSQPQNSGEQEAGGGGGAPPSGEDLSQEQREVLIATWNVARAGVDDEQAFRESAQVVRDGQDEVLEKLLGLAEEMRSQGAGDAALQELVRDISEQMRQALVAIDASITDSSVARLRDAVGPEQEAYQGLLQLREKEFNVARGARPNPGSSRGSASAAPMDAQMQQLELRNSESRYETERQAQARSQEAGRETRQALSRLKELARRQQDQNQRLRELQAELEAAKSEEEREEIQRILDRLRESQEEILRDADELRQRMEETNDRPRLTQERERMEEMRENVRRASEALEGGRLSEALAEGARAQSELRDLEQELRDASASELEDRLRDLKRETARVEREEERLAEALRETERGGEGALRTSEAERGAREALEEELRQQEEDVARLLEDIESTFEEAEKTEPLVAEELYEALDNARDKDLEEALEMTRELAERGFPEEAREVAKVAQRALRGLREDVERAADNALGSGEQALERASEELRQLSEALEGEVARARGEAPAQRGEPGGEGQAGQERQEGQGQASPGPPNGEPGEGPGGLREGAPQQPGVSGGGGNQRISPLTGEDFLSWSDRLRDVEEILDDLDLSAEAARLRARARAVREDYKRHSREPEWDLVEDQIAKPLGELGRLVEEELRRRRAEDERVPIDRDPVPPQFEDDVRRYYERLGQGR